MVLHIDTAFLSSNRLITREILLCQAQRGKGLAPGAKSLSPHRWQIFSTSMMSVQVPYQTHNLNHMERGELVAPVHTFALQRGESLLNAS